MAQCLLGASSREESKGDAGVAIRRRKTMKVIFHILSAALMFFMNIDSNAANAPPLVMEEFMVPAVDPGISLYVRNKHPQGAVKFPGEKIVLYVHGSTYPSE